MRYSVTYCLIVSRAASYRNINNSKILRFVIDFSFLQKQKENFRSKSNQTDCSELSRYENRTINLICENVSL